MEFETRYGPLYVTRHAVERWVQRTGRARRDGARAGSSNVTMPISS